MIFLIFKSKTQTQSGVLATRMRRIFSARISFAILLALALVGGYFISLSEPQQAQADPKREAPNYKGSFEKFSKPDSLTAEIRSRSSEVVRVKFKNFEQMEMVGRFGKVIEDLGSSAIISTKRSAELSRAGYEFTRLETTINLPGAKFDPLATPPAETIAPRAELEGGGDYFVVQFGTTTSDELLNSLRDAGVEVIQYVPHQAFFVYGDSEAISKVAGHSRVRWVGRYLPEQKASSSLEAFVIENKSEKARFDIAVFKRESVGQFSNRFREIVNGRILHESILSNNYFNVLQVEVTVEDIASLLALSGVVRIDPFVTPLAEDERSAQIVAGNFSSSTMLNGPGYNPLGQFSVDGSGVTVSVVDTGVSIPGAGGFYITSTNTINADLGGASPGSTGHGHSVATMIAGSLPFGTLDSQGYAYAMGVAPKTSLINIPYLLSGYGGNAAKTSNDTVTTLGTNGIRGSISNNSWGSGLNGNSYDSFAAQYDGFVLDASFAESIDPLLVVFSAGNDGTAGMTRPKMAKNPIAVGNSENLRSEILGTGADNIEDLRSSSGRGPAFAGRIKPDITAPGTAIASGNGTSATCNIDAFHCSGSGTSFAAPQVAGAAALFTQYWKERNAGQYPRPSLIKASIISSGQEMNGLTTNLLSIPNGNEGWGRMNMRLMMNTGVPMKHVNESHEFTTPGQSVVYSGNVSDPTKPVRFTLTWSDPPGVADPALVNNLDLTVQVGANTYRGNVFASGVSVTGGANSTIDNVENIFLGTGIPAGTPVTITIGATALNGDGILGNADATDQHFSLVAYNFAEPNTSTPAPYDFTGDGRTDLAIYRPSLGEWWYSSTEAGGGSGVVQFGTPTDVIVPGDYTGDGKTDFTLFRPATGEWLVLRSEDLSYFAFPFGSAGDVPSAGDFNGDGRADHALFRASSGTWFIQISGGGVQVQSFGIPGDLPSVGDYDGDGLADVAIYRPNGGSGSGEWWINRSLLGVIAFPFGSSTDRVVQGDYTGDGKTDSAIWRPSTGFWYILRSEDNSFFGFPFGTAGDVPIPGDYDGDGAYDSAVFRPSTNTWFMQRSTAGTLITTFGITGDKPVPSAFVR